MRTIWTPTAAALPSDGAPVEFLLDARACPLRGIYALGRFESRWTIYPPTSVRQWRSTLIEVERVRSPASNGLRSAGLHAGPGSIAMGKPAPRNPAAGIVAGANACQDDGPDSMR